MLFIYLDKGSLYFRLLQKLEDAQIPYTSLATESQNIDLESLDQIYSGSLLLMDESLLKQKSKIWQELVQTISRRTQLILITENTINLPPFQNQICYINKSNVENAIDAILMKVKKIQSTQKAIPMLNKSDFGDELSDKKFLNVLLIDATAMNCLRTNYGQNVYNKTQEIFDQVLQSLWSTSGGFRSKDKIYRKAPNSQYYYVLLEDQRKIKRLSVPGNLEAVADRLYVSIQNKIFEELFFNPNREKFSLLMSDTPDIKLGYASCVFNPCIDIESQVIQVIEATHRSAQSHFQRMQERIKDFLNILLRNPEIITPSYQAIFDISKVDGVTLKNTEPENRIKMLQNELRGFEALARLDKKLAKDVLGIAATKLIDFQYFNPELLFNYAKRLGLAGELDQACFHRALELGNKIPGPLYINILPSNLYHIDQINYQNKNLSNVVFEVSEAEAINNIELMQQVRKSLGQRQIKIAADDFGIGYAGIDRIIQLAPDTIKIDRTLIQDIDKNPQKQHYLSAILHAAKQSNTMILAEGLETSEELVCLQKLGIQYAQGYYLHRPATTEQILDKLNLTNKSVRKLYVA